MTITSETTFDKFRVRINGIIQMSVNRNVEIFQSWQVDKTYYAIELTTKDGAVSLFEYDDIEKWKTIIYELENHKII